MRKLLYIIPVLIITVSFAGNASETELNVNAENAASNRSPLENWAIVFEVFSHPRCANCHVPEDNRPRQSGPSYGLNGGEWKYHGMNIDGGETRDGAEGIPCKACHASSNAELTHGPPGAPGWALAPVEMVWWQKSSGAICEQIKDPARNGQRSLQDVADHIDHDALVHWGWDPGPGREPAPYSVAETVAAFEGWMTAGAPCPDGQ